MVSAATGSYSAAAALSGAKDASEALDVLADGPGRHYDRDLGLGVDPFVEDLAGDERGRALGEAGEQVLAFFTACGG